MVKIICENIAIVSGRRVISSFDLSNFTYITDDISFFYVDLLFSLSV